jgi:hypothetical protein
VRQDRIEGLFDNPGEKIDEVLDLLELLFPILPELIAKSTGKDIEEILDWEFDDTIKASLIIVIQNVGRIKNLFGLAREIKSLGV